MSDLPTIEALLREHGLTGVAEEPFPNDGWSGASMTLLRRSDGRRFVLKRDSLARDWIARATNDRPILREAWFAADGPALPWPVRNPALGAARTTVGGELAILMPDLTGVLFDWNTPLSESQLDAVLAALSSLHAAKAPALRTEWTGWTERVTLICRPTLERPGPAREAVADRLLPGWDAWDRLASRAAQEVIAALADDVTPLLDAMAAAPWSLIHGDLKLANAGIAADGAIEMVDWQMVTVAPAGLELGWFLVANVNALPLPPDEVLRRYWAFRGTEPGPQDDIAILVGLLLRGWRKGFDAEAGITLGSGVSARDDLAWWSERAVEAADRLF